MIEVDSAEVIVMDAVGIVAMIAVAVAAVTEGTIDEELDPAMTGGDVIETKNY